MKKIFVIGLAAGMLSLSACNSSPAEQAADNVEAVADNVADNLEDMADNATTEAGAEALENQADAVEDRADNVAADLRTNDPDTNLSNGM
jgi:protein involved in sex pheromone biosynthesis